MSEKLTQSTVVDIVEALKGMQIMASRLDNHTSRLQYVRDALVYINPSVLLDHNFMVSSLMVWAKKPELMPDRRQRLNEELLFMGRTASCRYLYGRSDAVNSFTIDFEHPDVINVPPGLEETYEADEYQVPILAIDSLVLAEAA